MVLAVKSSRTGFHKGSFTRHVALEFVVIQSLQNILLIVILCPILVLSVQVTILSRPMWTFSFLVDLARMIPS